MNNIKPLLKQFNWRFLLVRLLVSTLALVITAALLPNIYFVQLTVGNIVIVVLALGILNALVRPIVQFLTLSFIFVTFGLVMAVINGLMLFLLDFFLPGRFAVDGLFWVLVGGLLLWLLGSFFESMLGLTLPIIPEDRPELRQQISQQTTTFGQLLWKARAERGIGLMGEEITTVEGTGAIAATSSTPVEAQMASPPMKPPEAGDGASAVASAGASKDASGDAEISDAEIIEIEVPEPEDTVANIAEQQATSPTPGQEQDS